MISHNKESNTACMIKEKLKVELYNTNNVSLLTFKVRWQTTGDALVHILPVMRKKQSKCEYRKKKQRMHYSPDENDGAMWMQQSQITAIWSYE